MQMTEIPFKDFIVAEEMDTGAQAEVKRKIGEHYK